MPGVQRFLAQSNNVVAEAAVTASSVLPSAAVKQTAVSRAGNGRVKLVGDYTGAEDATIEIAVVDGGTTQRASAPVFAGVGNGTLSVVGVDVGATNQVLTYTLADLGTATAAAGLAVDDVTLRARVAGAGGNSIRLTVTPDLTLTATAWSLLADWPAGQAYQVGPQWEFGALPLLPSGELDAASPRLRFGHDPEVYRPYREYKDGAWRVGLSPALQRDVTAGTVVWAVTGGYDVVVTDGVTPEAYADVVSFYDLCTALASSDLVEVAGVVAADRAPGGMAAVDVPLRTSAWLLSASGTALEAVSVAAAAPTETVSITCINADAIGDEVWSVSGPVSGALGQATTGVPFVSGAVSFTVPDPVVSDLGAGRFATRFNPTTRADGEAMPSVCVRNFTLGRNARPKSITFTYRERPQNDCDCNTATLSGRITNACLGLEGPDMSIDPDYKSRLDDVYGVREAFIRDETAEAGSGTSTVPDPYYQVRVTTVGEGGVAGADGVLSTDSTGGTGFAQKLLYATSAAASTAAAAIAVGNPVYYSAAEPGLNSTDYPHLGFIVAAGGEVPVSLGLAPDYEELLPRDVYPGSVLTVASVVVDGPISSASYSRSYFLANQADIDWINSVVAIMLDCLAQVYSVAAAVAEWDALWTEVQGDIAVITGGGDETSNASNDPRFLDRYRAACDNILLTAGILPKSSASTAAGDGCWRDDPSATHWWVDDSGYYFPAFSNKAYISSAASCGSGASAGIPAGEPYSTREFGMHIAVGCTERLKVGDQVTVAIEAVDGVSPYAVGDSAELAVVAAGPAWLTGGVTGDDTLTWSVVGSVDGPLADYDLTALEPAYHHGGAEVQIHRGGIPFGLGDQFTVEISAAQYKWRKDAGAWSTPADIEDGDIAIVDGLSARFTAGAAPSWVAADAWTFQARQPNAPSHVLVPTVEAWAWSGTGAVLTVDLGGVETVAALALARYDLPAGATVTIEGGDGATWPESQAMDVSGAVSVVILASAWEVSHLRVTVASASGGRIGWIWAGVPLATTYSAARCRVARAYAIQRGDGLNANRLYQGQGRKGEIAWDADSRFLFQADLDALMAMLDAMQQAGHPMILVPHHLHPGDAALVQVDMDSIDPVEYHELGPDDTAKRVYSLALALSPVHQ
jgi:hypothetical protein